MISLIIIAILTMSLIATISINMLTLGNQTEQVIRTIEEKNDIESIKSAIKQEFRPVGLNRALSLPIGAISTRGYTTIPNSLSINKENAWGYDYIYCPYSTTPIAGAGNGVIQTTASSSYAINTTTYDGKEYIVASEQPAISEYNVIAVLISPIPSLTLPKCEDVRYDSVNKQFYTLNYDGIVEVIREDTSIISREPVVLDISASDTSIRINEEVSDWNILLPELYTVNLDSGNHQTNNVNFISPLESKSKQIKIIGTSSGVTTITSSIPISFNFENVVVVLENVTFANSISVNITNSDVYMNNVTLKLNNVKDSKVKLQGPASFNTGSRMLVDSSVIDIRGYAAQIIKQNNAVGIELISSEMHADNINFQNATSGGIGILAGPLSKIMISGNAGFTGSSMLSGISLDSRSDLILDGGSLSTSLSMDTMLFMQGRADIKNSIFTGSPSTNNAIVMGDGAELNLSSSQIGTSVSSPVNGIRDLGGAKFISGNSTIINATSVCWSGDIFYLATSANGSTSNTVDVYYQIANKSLWSCQN